MSLGVAAGSGLLLVLAFPKFNLFALAAVALLPLLVMTFQERSAWRRLAGGYLAGIIFFAGSCYWIYSVQREYGGLAVPQAALVFAMFCGVLALYWGVFAWLAGYLWNLSWGPAVIAMLWVALEYARSHLFTGFPWLLLGSAATDYFPVARMARWTGVYGLSYLLAALPAACAWLLLRPGRPATAHLIWVAGVVAALSLTAPDEQYGEDQTAFLVQTNIPQEVAFEPWDQETQAPLLARLRELTIKGVGRQKSPALVAWPEVPAPFYFWEDSFTRQYAEAMARNTNSNFVMGIVAYVPGSNGAQPTNSMVVLAPSGEVLAQYDKIHLVPFGEYVPLRRWLVLAEKLTAEIGDFVPGSKLVVSQMEGGRMSGLICYEVIFPDLVRRFVRNGAEVLVNISNDGWYGSSAARYQHLLIARMRAIENARYLLRATNTGITAVIRPDGRVTAELAPDRPGVLRGQWSFQQRQTFYTRHGDVFAMAACVLAGLGCLAGIRSR
jgi:apolipoprotein N-acyltransferase